MGSIEAGTAAGANLLAYSSIADVPYAYPIIVIMILVVIVFLVRRSIRKDRITTQLYYHKNEKVKSITQINSIPDHTIGTIVHIHNTNPITFDVEFKDENGQILGTEKVDDTSIVSLHTG